MDGRAAVRRLIALGALLIALIIVGTGALLLAGSRALDSLEAREHRAMVRSLVTRRLDRVEHDMRFVTDALQRRTPQQAETPIATVAQNAALMLLSRGHDWTVMLDPGDRAVLAWRAGRRSLIGSADFVEAAQPLLRRVRAGATSASGLVVVDGVGYLAVAARVAPANADADEPMARRPLLLSAQRLDHEAPAAAARLGATGAHLLPGEPHSETAVGLTDVAGRPAGQIAWSPQHVGLKALRDAAPLVLAGFGIFAALAGALGWQILRVAKGLLHHERALANAMGALGEARDRAEAANIAKSQFLANMSHEIRTPLNGVLGMAQVMGRSELASEDRARLQVIRTSGEDLLRLLNDLLDISKIEAGCMELDLHEFDLEDLVETATRPFAVIAEQKDVVFAVRVEPDARGIWRGDGGRLRQVLANLASNAVKFTDAGEIDVAVRRTPVGLACAVRDTGGGIPSDRLGQLFQRFSQLDPTATRRVGGTGLGLAISRELIELMGGRISVETVEGEGSIFAFDISLPWIGPARTAETENEAGPDLPTLRILAAEDNPTNQLILAAMLEPLGVELQVVGDGVDAVEAFAAERFDLLLMDVQMPRLNGVDAARAIRALERDRQLPATPMLALSANVMRHQVEEYLAAGMNGLVAKPIEMRELVRAIEQALAEQAGAEVAA